MPVCARLRRGRLACERKVHFAMARNDSEPEPLDEHGARDDVALLHAVQVKPRDVQRIVPGRTGIEPLGGARVADGVVLHT